jgi:hypothetical protein
MRTVPIALFLLVAVGVGYSAAEPIIYVPGDSIPSGQFAASAIFQGFLNSDGSPVVGQNILGVNSQELFIQRTSDFAAPSNLRFDGVLNDTPVAVGERFLLGYLTYTNGLFLTSTFLGPILTQTVGATDVLARYTQSFSDRVKLEVTQNFGTAEQNADIVSFEGRPDLGSLRVYEGQAGAIQLFGMFGSLDLFSFGNVVSAPGSGFYFPTVGTVPSDFVPTLTGDGTFIPAAPAAPEPATMTLLGSALALTILRRRGNRRP